MASIISPSIACVDFHLERIGVSGLVFEDSMNKGRPHGCHLEERSVRGRNLDTHQERGIWAIES